MNELEKYRKEINRIDAEMSRLFTERMSICREVAAYKKAHALSVYDSARELELFKQNRALSDDPIIESYYVEFLRKVLELSRSYQSRLLEGMQVGYRRKQMLIPVQAGVDSYEIILAPGALKRAGQWLNLHRRALIVTDEGVPPEYAQTVAAQCSEPFVLTLPSGEANKSLEQFGRLLNLMLQASFTRQDCVIAVGGGVIGDLSGFAAACYMRGLAFYNLPTTLLAQVDSSIGGKTAVNLAGVKNVVGSFYSPEKVLIDPETLVTLPRRQLAAGLAEVLKIALTSSAELFELLESSQNLAKDLPEIIRQALLLKKTVVEKDPRETGLRRVLNFGHTWGHALESFYAGQWLHGECIALGMLPMCASKVADRLRAVLEKYGLPTQSNATAEQLLPYLLHDKKRQGDKLTVVYVDKVGQYRLQEVRPTDLAAFWNQTN